MAAPRRQRGAAPPQPTLCFNGRHFWPAMHDRERNVRLCYWYVEAEPFWRKLDRTFDVRTLPDYSRSEDPGEGRIGRAEFVDPVAFEARWRGYHAEVIRRCLERGLDPKAFRHAA